MAILWVNITLYIKYLYKVIDKFKGIIIYCGIYTVHRNKKYDLQNKI